MKTTQHTREPPKPAKQQICITLNFNNMKTKHYFTTFLALLFFNTFAQLDKKTWLVGGDATFSYSNIRSESSYGKIQSVGNYTSINPNIGYFIIDKIACGISLFTSFGHTNGNSVKSGISYGGGPFVRYYILKKEKPYNILTELGYRYGTGTINHGTSNNLTMKTGIVVFFNSSVALEFLCAYNNQHSKYENNNTNGTQISVGLGLQVHLEK